MRPQTETCRERADRLCAPNGRRPPARGGIRRGIAEPEVSTDAARHRGRRGDGDDAPGLRPRHRRLRGPRGLQRGAQRQPPRRRHRHPRGLLRRRLGRGRDQHVRREPREPGRVRDRRPDRRAFPGRRATRQLRGHEALDARPAALGPRQRRSRHQTPQPRPGHAGTVARRLRRADPRDDRRRCRRDPRRDRAGPPAGEVGVARRPSRDRRAVPGHPVDRQRHRRDHRHHADGQRDRRRTDQPGAVGHRPHRSQLRHRPGRDERASPVPGPARRGPARVHAERRTAPADRGRRALPPHSGRARATRRNGSSTTTASRWSAAAAAPPPSTSANSPSGSPRWCRSSAIPTSSVA